MAILNQIQRLSNRLHKVKLSPLSRLLDGVSRFVFSASVPGRAEIGKGVFFHHGGLGVVINNRSVIGDDCEIGVHVVLGGKAPIVGAPRLGRGVIVHAGAKIIGPVTIGDGVIIAANAVVVEDVPPRCMVAGVPATIKRRDIDARLYRHDASPHGAPND
ncbi:serine O-acetyltransferase [Caulobacter sp. DWP3-1-3b2]|uniref:serine O-acetyltransferase n=1 Tax=Caulobacter sp. DWP3-1-3b2 TaxID=2804643 RepID=UPI003CFBB08A